MFYLLVVVHVAQTNAHIFVEVPICKNAHAGRSAHVASRCDIYKKSKVDTSEFCQLNRTVVCGGGWVGGGTCVWAKG